MTTKEKLRNYRLKNNLTQKELGILMGFSISYPDTRIRAYESGRLRISAKNLMKFAEIFKIEPFELLGDDAYVYGGKVIELKKQIIEDTSN